MILDSCIKDAKDLLRDAAAAGTTLSFRRLFQVFPAQTPASDVWDTLEAACEELADWRTAIYSAVLAKSGNGLPGNGFFDIFEIHRHEEYRRIAGRTLAQDLNQEQRLEMVLLERATVYAHARI